ncbi:MAG: rhomboid family intramembrane serine protease [Armatimonadetes bacterium]|nr:rhomboid family intramembrane serine protease [Armatimonadota bacterium]
MARADQQKTPAYATSCLLAAQILVWLTIVFFYANRDDWWPYVFNPASPHLQGFLISPFVHLHPFHLGVNLAVLWLFGVPVERGLGSLRFLALFLASAWCASVMHWAVIYAFHGNLLVMPADGGADQVPRAAALGSSGAVAGVLGVYCVRFPHVPIRFPLLPDWRIQPLHLLGAWVLLELVQALSTTVGQSPSSVGHWAHFAGFVFGMWYARVLGLQRRARGDQLSQAADDAAARGDYAAAAQAWSALLASDRENFALRRKLVAARIAQADLDGAAALAAETLQLAVRGRHTQAAVADYRYYGAMFPRLRLLHGIRFRIGTWMAELGDPAGAYEALALAAEEDAATPGAASALFRAGEVAADCLHDPLRARQMWRRILLDHPHSPFHDLAQQRLQALSQPRSPS